jgi:hypothetical protein
MPPPAPKSRIATMKFQKYTSWPCPNGCSGSGGRRLRRIPNSSTPWFAVSTTEWTPSDSMTELPVKAAARNFAAAITKFAASAAYTATARGDSGCAAAA